MILLGPPFISDAGVKQAFEIINVFDERAFCGIFLTGVSY
jgi:hypothetical protein